MKKLFTFCLALCATTALWADFTPAAFSVAAGKQVYFSQGNLQCTLSATKTWSFAENQYDMIGTANVSNSALADKIDLFGWSGDNTTAPWGISTSATATDYEGDFVDWGKNIGDGWRTLTNKEWEYLLDTRANAQNLKGLARINLDGTEYANGLIFLPDNWTAPKGIKFVATNTTYADNTFTLDQWQQLETNGAIFLPASGMRSGSTGTSMSDIQNVGYYWSATVTDESRSYFLKFLSNDWYVSASGYVYCGYAVRLVQDVYAITITTPENGTVTADMTTAAAGKTVTLTIEPATGYELETLTVKDAYNNTFTVTGNTFTMPARAVTVTATFKKIDYAINIANNIENGKVSVTSGETTANYGDEVTLTITPETGYEVEKIAVTYGDGQIVKVIAYKFTMPASAVTVSATFKATTPVVSNFTPAAFSVAADKQVYFSQGNLQYTQSISKWAFADNQYDIIGTDNVTGGEKGFYDEYGEFNSGTDLADKIDLFGWSANNEAAPWGISISTSINDYSGDFVDWGKNFGNGTTWRTLTNDEWEYLLSTRTNAENLKGIARIKLSDAEYVNGLVILPDSWKDIDGIAFKNGFSSEEDNTVSGYVNYQSFTLADWQKMEAAGALFLPAAGHSGNTSVEFVQLLGYYWSASHNDDDGANHLLFGSSTEANMDRFARYNRMSVRLVQDLYAVNVATITNGTVEASKTVAAVGETITLTITPETGYEVESVIATNTDTKIPLAVSEDYKFTMPAANVSVSATFKATTATALQSVEMAEIYAENGTIYGAEGMQIFTITGQNVTEMNGQLNGVYIVKCADKAQKIIVR
jgi:hypothetical protein